jgi:sulfoxide reductase catalytic subunit YedY
MNVIRRRGWEMPESRATPEHLFFNRRALLTVAVGAATIGLAPNIAQAQRITDQPDPSLDLYPAKRNETFTLDRPITDE